MKKIAIAIVGLLGLGAIGLVAGASMQDDHTHLERSVVVEATPADMTYFSHDLQGVNAWSPWEDRDPNQTREYSDPSSGVGATYHWSGNDEVGEGTMTISSAKDGEVVTDLHFLRPFESKATATISYAAEGDKTKVTWAYDQDNDFGGKMMLMFFDMEAMLGPDFEKGLELLKPLVEEAARERVAAEQAEAKAEAEAAARAEAEAAAAAAAEPAEGDAAAG